MVDQHEPQSAPPVPQRGGFFSNAKGILIAVLTVGLVAAVSTNVMSAFGQGFGGGFGPHFGWRGGWHGGGPLTPEQIDDRIERMTKHAAIELDATPDQQAKVATILKAAVADLRPLREKARAARSQAVTLLTAATIDRTAIEKLRSEQIALAETASKRIAQALADTAEVLNPDQRKKVADWIANGPWARWHHG